MGVITQIGIYSPDGTPLFAAGADAMGGIVVVRGNDPNHVATMAINRHGGHVSVGGAKQSGAGLRTNKRGGQLIVAEMGGKEVVSLGVYEHGGFVVVSEIDEQSSVGMYIDGIVRTTDETTQPHRPAQ